MTARERAEAVWYRIVKAGPTGDEKAIDWIEEIIQNEIVSAYSRGLSLGYQEGYKAGFLRPTNAN